MEVPKLGIEPEQKYLKVNETLPKNKLVFMKASLGSGKTTTVKNLRSEGLLSGRFLSITNRVSLVEGIATDFNARKDELGDEMPPYKYSKRVDRALWEQDSNGAMSTTIHSLHHFDRIAQEGGVEVLFIDECDAVLNELLNGPAHILRNRKACIDTLTYLLATAKYVVLADGDIDADTMFGYFFLCAKLKVKDIVSIDHRYAMLTDAVATEVKTEETLWVQGVHCALDEGKKVLVMTDVGPEALNTRLENLGILHPDHNIVAIHADSKENELVRDILNNTTDALVRHDIDCVLCSPTVVSGVDFHYFDTVCLLTVSDTASPNLRFQALRRCRRAKEFWLYTNPDISGFKTGYRKEFLIDPLDLTKQRLALRREVEYNGYLRNLRFLLLDQGCSVEVISDREPSLESIAKDASDGLSGSEIELNNHIQAILHAKEDVIIDNYNNAFEERKQIAHYLEIEDLNLVTEEDITYFLTKKIHKRMDALASVVRGKLWTALYYSVNDIEGFVSFLQQYGQQWYNATGNNASTLGKFKRLRNAKEQARKLGLVLYPREDGIESNKAQVKSWFRQYCSYSDIPIPVEFMTVDELTKANETAEDLTLRSNLVSKEAVSSTAAAKDWASFMEVNE